MHLISLTKRETADLEFRRQLLTYAKEYKTAGDIVKADRYSMPDEKGTVIVFFKFKNPICLSFR